MTRVKDPHTREAVCRLSTPDLEALIDQNSKWADEAEKELDRREMDEHDPHIPGKAGNYGRD